MLLLLDGRWEDAAESWAAAVAADEYAGDLHDAAVNLRWLAEAQAPLGDRDGALVSLERALALGITGTRRCRPSSMPGPGWRSSSLPSGRRRRGPPHRCDEILAAAKDWRGAVGIGRAGAGRRGCGPRRRGRY